MSALAKSALQPNKGTVLLKAFNNACAELSVSKTVSCKIIGLNRATLSRKENTGISPDSKSAELCLHFIRLYRSLFAISGGDKNFMNHWFTSSNSALGGKPAELVLSVIGLIQVNDYLDAMRGKI